MPNIRCKPCRVTDVSGTRYEVSADGTVRETSVLLGQRIYGEPLPADEAQIIRREAARQRRNRTARLYNQAMRDMGLKRTRFGWE